uniref:Necrosis inducing-like protein NPP1 type n=1 Tax=Phytophthora ramorum TaxID=164328 RepID=H3GB05_PHYRM
MNIGRLFVVVAVAFFSVEAASIDHDKVQPFPQPDPVTITEKSGVKFKPELHIDTEHGCASYPAVNSAGETSGGLKGTKGTSACTGPILGSQVYGRAEWHNDVWAIMYAWYFPKGFWDSRAYWRHDWSNAVVWIDDPALENPKVLGLSLSTSENKYGHKYVPAEALRNGTTPSLYRMMPTYECAELVPYYASGEVQDLIMWDQLTDAARAALNDQDNFGRTEVPINDDHFLKHLEKAWPL